MPVLYLNRIDVYVAEGATPLVISCSDKVPEIVNHNFNAVRDDYRKQGEALAQAMLRAMPGGLVDGLFLALLDHKRSIYRVPHIKDDDTKETT